MLESTIGIVLVNEDDKIQEHVIYYLIRGLKVREHKLLRVDNLALEIVHVIHRLYHYILLKKAIFVSNVNYFHFFFT